VRKGLIKEPVQYYYSSLAAFEKGNMDPLEIDWIDW
jgi:hypothetical protein